MAVTTSDPFRSYNQAQLDAAAKKIISTDPAYKNYNTAGLLAAARNKPSLMTAMTNNLKAAAAPATPAKPAVANVSLPDPKTATAWQTTQSGRTFYIQPPTATRPAQWFEKGTSDVMQAVDTQGRPASNVPAIGFRDWQQSTPLTSTPAQVQNNLTAAADKIRLEKEQAARLAATQAAAAKAAADKAVADKAAAEKAKAAADKQRLEQIAAEGRRAAEAALAAQEAQQARDRAAAAEKAAAEKAAAEKAAAEKAAAEKTAAEKATAALVPPKLTIAQQAVIQQPLLQKLNQVTTQAEFDALVKQAADAGAAFSEGTLNNQKIGLQQRLQQQEATQKAAAVTQYQNRIRSATTAADIDTIVNEAKNAGISLDTTQIDRQKNVIAQQEKITTDIANTIKGASPGDTGRSLYSSNNVEIATLPDNPTTGEKGGFYIQSGGGFQQVDATGRGTGSIIPADQFNQLRQSRVSGLQEYQRYQTQLADQARQAEQIKNFEAALPKPGSEQFNYLLANRFVMTGPDGRDYELVAKNEKTNEPAHWIRSVSTSPNYSDARGVYERLDAPGTTVVKGDVNNMFTQNAEIVNARNLAERAARIAAAAEERHGTKGLKKFLGKVALQIAKFYLTPFITEIGSTLAKEALDVVSNLASTGSTAADIGSTLQTLYDIPADLAAEVGQMANSTVIDTVNTGAFDIGGFEGLGDMYNSVAGEVGTGAFDMAGFEGVPDIYGAGADAATGAFDLGGMGDVFGGTVPSPVIPDDIPFDTGAFDLGGMQDIPTAPIAPPTDTGAFDLGGMQDIPTAPIAPPTDIPQVDAFTDVPTQAPTQAPYDIRSTGQSDLPPRSVLEGPNGPEVVLDNGKTVLQSDLEKAVLSERPISIDGMQQVNYTPEQLRRIEELQAQGYRGAEITERLEPATGPGQRIDIRGVGDFPTVDIPVGPGPGDVSLVDLIPPGAIPPEVIIPGIIGGIGVLGGIGGFGGSPAPGGGGGPAPVAEPVPPPVAEPLPAPAPAPIEPPPVIEPPPAPAPIANPVVEPPPIGQPVLPPAAEPVPPPAAEPVPPPTAEPVAPPGSTPPPTAEPVAPPAGEPVAPPAGEPVAPPAGEPVAPPIAPPPAPTPPPPAPTPPPPAPTPPPELPVVEQPPVPEIPTVDVTPPEVPVEPPPTQPPGDQAPIDNRDIPYDPNQRPGDLYKALMDIYGEIPWWAKLGAAGLALMPGMPELPTRNYGPLPPTVFGTTGQINLPGVNPGFFTSPTPFYQTTSPVQARYYYGQRPLQTGTVFNQQAYNTVPGAPAQPFGLQEMYTPTDINQYLQSLNTVAGPVAPPQTGV